jgi:hypothetical protein
LKNDAIPSRASALAWASCVLPSPSAANGARSYGSVRSILDNKLDRQAAAKRAADGPAILHANIRGPRYYN